MTGVQTCALPIYRSLDLRNVLPKLEIENGGGHEGAIGFRVERSNIDDFGAFVARIVETLKKEVQRDTGEE